MINKREAILENMVQTFERLGRNSLYARFIRDESCARIETELPLTIFNRVFDYQAPYDDKIDARGTLPGMAVDLEAKAINLSPIPGLRIETVHTDDELTMFKQVFAADYDLPDELAYEFTEAFAHDPEGRMRYFLAYLNDVPAGTVMTFSTGDVTGIYTVATLKDFRTRGIGGALVGHALRDMQAEGAKLAVLQASAMGQTIYRKHGFEEELTIHLYV